MVSLESLWRPRDVCVTLAVSQEIWRNCKDVAPEPNAQTPPVPACCDGERRARAGRYRGFAERDAPKLQGAYGKLRLHQARRNDPHARWGQTEDVHPHTQRSHQGAHIADAHTV